MGQCNVRTDLALEARESVSKTDSGIKGMHVTEYEKANGEILVTKVVIDTANAARTMGKPVGTYITIESPAMVQEEEEISCAVAECVAEVLKEMVGEEGERSILVVGLGNRDVTADALGPQVVDHLQITRHILKNYGRAAYSGAKVYAVSSIEPGVMAKTGMETAEIVRGVVEETRPDLVVVIDALAARSVKRLNRTIQISNTGIQPGSGVGNHRNALTMETLGVPVIAVGVPTVASAATIVNDAMEGLLQEANQGKERYFDRHSAVFAELNNMYMTGKDIDAVIHSISHTLSEGINLAFEPTGQRADISQPEV